MQRARVLRAIIFLLLLLAAAGCKTVEKRPDDAPRADTVGQADSFKVAPHPGATLDTVIAAQLDGRGRREYIVATLDTSAEFYELQAGRASRIEFFSYDSLARAYKSIVAEELPAHRYEIRDVTGDGISDVVIFTQEAGNDIIATRGVRIYSWWRDSLRMIHASDHGDPELERIPGIAGEVINLHEEYWPPRGSHADATENVYVSDILAFRNGSFVSIRTEQSGRFLGYAEKYMAEYQKARRERLADTLYDYDNSNDSLRAIDSLAAESLANPSPLSTQAALAIIMLERAGQPRMIRSFWVSERDFIRRRIPGSDFEELEKLYMKAVKG
jgi:hypothetical protein